MGNQLQLTPAQAARLDIEAMRRTELLPPLKFSRKNIADIALEIGLRELESQWDQQEENSV